MYFNNLSKKDCHTQKSFHKKPRIITIDKDEVSAVIHDITERKQTEEDLKKLSRIVEQTADHVIVTDKEGVIEYVNSAFEKLTGHTKKEVIGKTPSLLKSDHHKSKFYKNLWQTILSGKIFRGVIINRKKNGELYYEDKTITPIRDEDGNITHFVSTGKDITEHKRAEQALLASEERYRVMYEDNPTMYFTVDTNGTVLSVNRFGAEQLGYTAKELIGKTVLNVFHKNDKNAVKKQLTQCIENSGLVAHMEFRKVRKDGSVMWVDEMARAIRDTEDKIVVLIVCEDITRRKQVEENLHNSHEQLRKLAAHLQSIREEERIRIAREVHDELGHALIGFKMGLSWIDIELSKPGNEKFNSLLQEKVSAITKSVDATVEVVRRITTELRPAILDYAGLPAAIEWQAQEFQKRTGIKCELKLPFENINLDQDQSTSIFRIFQETLTNVAHHSKATEVNINLHIDAANLVLKVSDNGKGITKSEISNKKSLGILGMRERLLPLGGEFKIYGAPGKGTTVTAIIPLNNKGMVI